MLVDSVHLAESSKYHLLDERIEPFVDPKTSECQDVVNVARITSVGAAQVATIIELILP